MTGWTMMMAGRQHVDFKIAVTYGGFMGRLARKLGLKWNHILFVQFYDDVPVWTYQADFSGVTGKPFDAETDLAWDFAWYEPVVPLTKAEQQRLLGFCLGALGKWYALHVWPRLFWRALKEAVKLRPARALLVPAETCVTFVNEACEAIRRPVSVHGARGLPDDVMSSPHWKAWGTND